MTTVIAFAVLSVYAWLFLLCLNKKASVTLKLCVLMFALVSSGITTLLANYYHETEVVSKVIP